MRTSEDQKIAAGRQPTGSRVACLAFHFLIISFSDLLIAQTPYIPPTDPLVKEKLAQWQDLKFGLLMHWGPYSQWGVVESWSICPEDEGWCARKPEHGATYNEYVKNYEALQTTFNPVKFNPDKWAKAAKDAGMKYMVFTTKHHDGFCMFDTKLTDYRVTDAEVPLPRSTRAPTSPRRCSMRSGRKACGPEPTSASPTGTARITGGPTSRRRTAT